MIVSERDEGRLSIIETTTQCRTVQVEVTGLGVRVTVGCSRFALDRPWPEPSLLLQFGGLIAPSDWAKVNDAVAFAIAEYGRRFP